MNDVKIHIKSKQTMPDEPDDTLSVDLAADGTMENRGGRVYIRYSEDVSGEGDNVDNVLSFDENDPSVISLVRRGSVGMSCVFEEGKRFPCKYDLKFAEMDFVIATKHVRNSIAPSKGGRIALSYAMEARGVVVQNTDYMLRVEVE